MAKPIAIRGRDATATSRLRPTPGTQVDDQVYWSQPKGINNLAKLSQIPNEFASDIENLILDEGFLKSRVGIAALGESDSRVQAVLSFTPANGAGVLLRIRTDGVDAWNGTV